MRSDRANGYSSFLCRSILVVYCSIVFLCARAMAVSSFRVMRVGLALEYILRVSDRTYSDKPRASKSKDSRCANVLTMLLLRGRDTI